MKKITLLVLCCSLIIGISTSCGSKSKTDTTEKTEKKVEAADSKFIKLADDINKKMPMPLPGGIRMDKVEAVSKQEFKFYYTFTQKPVTAVEEFKKNVRPMLTMALQTTDTPDIKLFKENKITLIYAYFTMEGDLFAELAVSPEEYITKQ